MLSFKKCKFDLVLPKNMKDVNNQDFKIESNKVSKIRVYVWLEGQDPDCDTDASQGGGIEVNIGLTKGETQGSMDRYNEIFNRK